MLYTSAAAYAADIKPIEAITIDLQQARGVAYYTVEPDGYRVVASMVAGENSTPMQITALLTDGQRLVLSVPSAVDQPATEVELVRQGEQLRVGTPAEIVANAAE